MIQQSAQKVKILTEIFHKFTAEKTQIPQIAFVMHVKFTVEISQINNSFKHNVKRYTLI
jgi:hypothetical protein